MTRVTNCGRHWTLKYIFVRRAKKLRLQGLSLWFMVPFALGGLLEMPAGSGSPACCIERNGDMANLVHKTLWSE
jgi:hypothetical protein